MIKLRFGYLFVGIVTGLIILANFFLTLPDGRLHITVCDVGQGDAIYVRLPDGRDMLVDGGPDDRVLECLGKRMPFYDRTLDLVFLTHPQHDHMQGIESVLRRFSVSGVVRTAVVPGKGFGDAWIQAMKKSGARERLAARGENITAGPVRISVLWPPPSGTGKPEKLGTEDDMNAHSLVLLISYGSFDALLMGDADGQVDDRLRMPQPADGIIEVLKVPHHGAKTGMAPSLVKALLSAGVPSKGNIAVISVGKNSYGHPATEALEFLERMTRTVYRTDRQGSVDITSDGRSFTVRTER